MGLSLHVPINQLSVIFMPVAKPRLCKWMDLPAAEASNDTMYNWYVFAAHVVYDDLAHFCALLPSIPKEEEVPALECRLHAAREDNDNGRGGIRYNAQAFPKHEGCTKNESECEQLRRQQSRSERNHVSWLKRQIVTILVLS